MHAWLRATIRGAKRALTELAPNGARVVAKLEVRLRSLPYNPGIRSNSMSPENAPAASFRVTNRQILRSTQVNGRK